MASIVITGANRGIGLALARAYASRGDKVIAAVRSTTDDLDALDVEVHEGVEVTDDAAVQRFADSLAESSVDVLIANAGIHSNETLDDLNWERIRRQFEVNTLGPLRVTRALLPRLHDGSKVAIITSRSGSIGDNGSGGTYGYRMSKAAVNMGGVDLALDLKPKGIPVLLLHPGMVRTDMGGGPGAVEPEDAAARMVARIDEMTLETTGRFLHAEGYELPW
ncbi:MAG: SDR family oxidoreductase [Bauldia sp.]|uniref:SDR family oxidoreductase n=1 Tax=Bauldia sp. TaxID=2575872 RepID=UPI001DA318F8|nr:SDR family oxidoreductase [Bauldia sp.]MCB1494144.1 SDR family oxidoreductase [Bauldia sp.]